MCPARTGGLVHGRTIGFLGVTGGSGTSSALLNCGAALARQSRDVIAAELGAWSSAFAAQLDRTPAGTLADLIATPDSAGLPVERCLVPLQPGMRVLFGSPVPPALSSFDARTLDRILHALAERADTVLVDLPVRLSAAFRLVVRHLDHVVLVAPPFGAHLSAAQESIRRLREWGIGRARMSLLPIIRDERARGRIEDVQMARELGVPLLGSVPAAHEAFFRASARGVPLLLAAPTSPAARALSAAAAELIAIMDNQRLKIALVNADDEQARRVSDLLDESDHVRFELVRAASIDGVLSEVSQGAFHAILVIPPGAPADLARELRRVVEANDRTAVVVAVNSRTGESAVWPCVGDGAQDFIELTRSDTYWLVHCLLAAIERQRLTHRLRAQHRELENCEMSHRRIIMQLLRETEHDPRMV